MYKDKEKMDGKDIFIAKQIEERLTETEIKSDYSRKTLGNKIDNKAKRDNYKNATFEGNKTITDPYTGRKLHKDSNAAKAKYGSKKYTSHTADVDHTVPLETIYEKGKYNPFLTTEDIRDIANKEANYKVINSNTNRSKGSKSNSQYVKDNKDKLVKNQDIKMKVEEFKANAVINAAFTGKTVKNIVKEGTNSAKTGAKYAAGISSAKNLKDVISGEKNLEEAVVAVGMDSAKAGARSFGAGVGTKIIEGTAIKMQQKAASAAIAKGATKFLESGGPGKAVIVVTEAGRSLKSYLDGEINETELVIELGEKGTGIAVSLALGVEGSVIGAGAGGVIGAIAGSVFPGIGTAAGIAAGVKVGAITGEIVGNMVGYMIGTELYNVVKNYISEHSFDPEETKRLNLMYTQLAEEVYKSRIALEKSLKEIHFEQEEQIMSGFKNMHNAVLNNDYNSINNSLADVCRCFEVKLAFETQDEFDDFMIDDLKSFKLGGSI